MPPSLNGVQEIAFADVTGGGKADTLIVKKDQIWIARTEDGAIYNFTYSGPVRVGFYGDLRTFFADVNGDGKADVIAVNRAGIKVRLSNGTYALPSTDWSTTPFYGDRGTYFADVDGDKRADAIMINYAGITVRLSKPAHQDLLSGLPVAEGFDSPHKWTPDGFIGDVANTFADVSGGGIADAIVGGRLGWHCGARFAWQRKERPRPSNWPAYVPHP